MNAYTLRKILFAAVTFAAFVSTLNAEFPKEEGVALKRYHVRQVSHTLAPDDFGWDGDAWKDIQELRIDSFHARTGTHRPDTRVKMVYDTSSTLHLLYRVNDCYVRSVHTERQTFVYLDSCVEFFVWPQSTTGYFNFEMNCGGTLLCKYYADAIGIPAARQKASRYLETEFLDKVLVRSTMPPVVDPEIAEPTTYFVRLTMPLSVLEAKVSTLAPLAGQTWRANFFKCGDKTSHPHWGAWNPTGEALSFHQPTKFGELIFE